MMHSTTRTALLRLAPRGALAGAVALAFTLGLALFAAPAEARGQEARLVGAFPAVVAESATTGPVREVDPAPTPTRDPTSARARKGALFGAFVGAGVGASIGYVVWHDAYGSSTCAAEPCTPQSRPPSVGRSVWTGGLVGALVGGALGALVGKVTAPAVGPVELARASISSGSAHVALRLAH